MIQFIKAALGTTETSSTYSEFVCPRVSLAGFKRLMTELETSPKSWPDDRQPLPSELFVNILNALEFERAVEHDRHMRLQPSDAFRIKTSSFSRCKKCAHMSKVEF